MNRGCPEKSLLSPETVAPEFQGSLFPPLNNFTTFVPNQRRDEEDMKGQIKRLQTIPRRRTISFPEALDEFMRYRIADGLAERTLKDYHFHIMRFFAWCYNKNINVWGDYHNLEQAIIIYFTKLTEYSPAYYNLALQNLKGFFNWCVQHGILRKNPAGFLKKRKDEAKIRSIEEKTLNKLLALPDQRTYAGLRDYVLMLLMLDTGIRPEEALSLEPEDFDLDRRLVTISAQTAKTRETRTLPFSATVCYQVKHLLSIRPEEWTNAPVFASDKGTKLRVDSLCSRFSRYSKQLGRKVAAYDLRHTFAIMYLRNGGDAFSLQKMLGHTDLSMTKRYLALAKEDLEASHNIASPVNKLMIQGRRMRNIRK